MFSSEDRERVRSWVLDRASSDERVVAGAALGSLATGEADAWSDLDLMLAVVDGLPVTEVLASWGRELEQAFDAVRLFDLQSGSITYRVFLLPNSLELDLSFVPASEFGAGGPKFQLLFGVAVELPSEQPTSPQELLGYAAHHVLHARACIERGRLWQAEYWVSAVRDHALHLACVRRGLDGWYGRDFDRLPDDVLGRMHDGLVRSLDVGELNRALACTVPQLLAEAADVEPMTSRLQAQLLELATGTWEAR